MRQRTREWMRLFNNRVDAYSKGAPDVLLERCRHIEIKGSIREMTEQDKIKALKISHHFAGSALRVLCFAYKEIKQTDRREDYENGLVFVGLQAMMDPIRDEARDSIEKCRKAGIKVVMITGDFEATASAIARQLGITGRVITGKEIDDINLKNEVMDIGVYARVNPEHKLRIIEAFKERGQIVAMTGDGINDAPALKKSDIGIAMGIKGTDVAKEASDMILLDDNFKSIVDAIEEGRTVYDNIRKFVDYLLSSNIGEVLVIFLAVMFGLPLPLIAVQILWINLATDGLPALALGVDPASSNIMDRRPRKPKSKILDLKKGSYLFFIGLVITIGTLALFEHYDPANNMVYAQTVAFSALMIFQMFNVFNCRSDYKSFFGKGMMSNKWLIGAVATSVLLQLAVIYTPLSAYFRTAPISGIDWIYIMLVSSSVLWAGELVKLLKRMLTRERAE
ncbi:MAG: HAD-IC family P-type ATPase [Candidatus Woesearchaeota archaeon]|nr:HAD-IC family P-type ATPase [Candidatus Woesearchaeota archaeon]